MTQVDTVQTVQPVPVLVEDSAKNAYSLAKSLSNAALDREVERLRQSMGEATHLGAQKDTEGRATRLGVLLDEQRRRREREQGSDGVEKDPGLQVDTVMNVGAVVDGAVVDVSVCSRSVLFVVVPRCTTHSCPL